MKEARTSFTGFRSLPLENKMAKNEATRTPAAPPPAASLAEQAAAIPVHPNAPIAPTDLPEKLPAFARVRSKVGDMRHLITNDLITDVERKIAIDFFAEAQIRSGKWEIVTD